MLPLQHSVNPPPPPPPPPAPPMLTEGLEDFKFDFIGGILKMTRGETLVG